MSSADYSKQISFRDDGIYVGDERIPGNLDAKFKVRRSESIPDHWEIDITLLTGVEPQFQLNDMSTQLLDAQDLTYRVWRVPGSESEVSA